LYGYGYTAGRWIDTVTVSGNKDIDSGIQWICFKMGHYDIDYVIYNIYNNIIYIYIYIYIYI